MKPDPAQARSPADSDSPGAAMRAHLRLQAGAGGIMSYRDFSAAALYAPHWGYYARADKARVGRRPESDFYTASSLSGGVWGKLLRGAAADLLGLVAPRDFALVEIGAEPGAGVFGADAGPFARVETRRLGESLAPPPRAVIFANEWLDAQPFHRFVFRRGGWRELGVQVNGAELAEVELPEISPAAQAFSATLPKDFAEEYHLDISLDAENILGQLAALPWQGGIMLADYGYDWADLLRERPAGTARAYHQHQVSGDLLAQPGGQDLTCHVCWDRLENVLRQHGFSDVRVERQEAFLVGHAAAEIEKILSASPGQFSPARQTLLELLHPAHLGQKFQILSARRI